MPIRAVIFDFGGVLSRTEDLSKHQQWEQPLGLSKGELPRIVFNSETAILASLGQATVADIWQGIADRFGLSAEEVRALERDFWFHELLDKELVAFLASLRPRYRTAILSNAFPDARELFTGRHGLDKVVDELIISAEVGMKKPDARIYQLAAERLGVQPQEAVFVDDWDKSVEGARAAGMHAVQFKNTTQTIADVQRYLEDGTR
jgi:epoxide hydrolase-like predicted phosphatase